MHNGWEMGCRVWDVVDHIPHPTSHIPRPNASKMRSFIGIAAGLIAWSAHVDAQTKVRVSGGEVTRRTAANAEASRLTAQIRGLDMERGTRVQVSGDSAQRIAMADFDWGGRVRSVEFDEEDSRLFWDVKIVPDSSEHTIVRYRVDANSGGILSIREFRGVRGLARRP
jgi:uncharacterized membrane protein YkoI